MIFKDNIAQVAGMEIFHTNFLGWNVVCMHQCVPKELFPVLSLRDLQMTEL